MTTTSVKNVGGVLNSPVMPAGAASKTAEESFMSVWNAQSSTGRADAEAKGDFESTLKQKNAAKPGDDLRAKDNSRKDIGREDTGRKTDELSKEELEKAAEVVGTATAELIQQIADTFGVSVEEIQGIMADMNLKPADLLQSENLSNLLLQVSGAENSLALLTNEQLYADYQMLMGQAKTLLEECSEALNMTPESLTDIPDAGEPVVEITVEEDIQYNGGQLQENAQLQGSTAGETAAQGGHQRENGEGRHSSQPDMGNLLLQNIQHQDAQSQSVQMQMPVSSWNTETQDLMRQIMDYMRIQVKPDVSSLEMQLHPASLGTLQIHVASEGGVLTARFVTENESVKAALENQMVQLKESFAEQGVKVEAIEVTVQTHQFEQNLEQGRGRQPQSETGGGNRTRTRRIQLGSLEGADGMEMPEEFSEDDKMTAEMMAANGQTVDYTA